ncbi:hypothetical protein OKA06_20035 [Novosphingobium sp. MW5]|nr:hypothetical protein [Novosphingobium sp. MW5]
MKLCGSDSEIFDACEDMFGRKLVTHQAGPEGQGVYGVYVEAGVQIEREIYLGLVLDRSGQRVMIVASAEGGMEIEEISAERPDSIVRATVEPAVGLREFQAREIAFALGLMPSLVQQMVLHAARLLPRLYRARCHHGRGQSLAVRPGRRPDPGAGAPG